MIDDNALAWAAGLFEGEGCITLNGYAPALELGSTDEDVVRKFAEIVRCGQIKKVTMRPIHKKQPWRWRCTNALDAIAVGSRMYPYLGERRQARYREVLARYECFRDKAAAGLLPGRKRRKIHLG